MELIFGLTMEQKVETITNHSIIDILNNPVKYVDESQDLVLLRIHPDTLVMIGQDEDQNYYLCVEDDESSRDYYPEKSLMTTFYDILKEEI